MGTVMFDLLAIVIIVPGSLLSIGIVAGMAIAWVRNKRIKAVLQEIEKGDDVS